MKDSLDISNSNNERVWLRTDGIITSIIARIGRLDKLHDVMLFAVLSGRTVGHLMNPRPDAETHFLL